MQTFFYNFRLLWSGLNSSNGSRMDELPRRCAIDGFTQGAKWGHAQALAQEPTDAEVLALIDSLAEQAGVFIMPLTASMALQDSRRASRRDEEKPKTKREKCPDDCACLCHDHPGHPAEHLPGIKGCPGKHGYVMNNRGEWIKEN